MLQIKVTSLLLLLTNICWAQTKPEEKILDLPIGIDEILTFDYNFSSNIGRGDPSIVGIKIFPRRREVIFKGQKKGETNVTIRDEEGNVRDIILVKVTDEGLSKTVKNIRELIGDVEGLEIGIKGGKVYVEGELVVPQDIGKVSTVLDGYPDVLRLIEVSPQTQRVIARKSF